MTKYVLFFLLLFYNHILYSQDNTLTTKIQSKGQRDIFTYFNIGILDFISVGLGYQFTKDVSISIKGSQTFIADSDFNLPNSGAGIGFKLTYHKSILFLSSVSFEYIPYLTLTLDKSIEPKSFIKGHFFDINFGNENQFKQGINFIYGLGICASLVKTKEILFFPSLKIGINYNI